jgi:hypothetical protein
VPPNQPHLDDCSKRGEGTGELEELKPHA